jgi:hypothetical protein
MKTKYRLVERSAEMIWYIERWCDWDDRWESIGRFHCEVTARNRFKLLKDYGEYVLLDSFERSNGDDDNPPLKAEEGQEALKL